MEKVFEDYFSELQADMVSIGLEYVENVADKIYIYCSYESKVIAADIFFCINGQLSFKHKINDIGTANYDVSINRQKTVISIIFEDLENIKKLCDEYKRDMPTEMKMVYDVKTHKFAAEYLYDLVYTHIKDKSASDVVNEWFEEVKNASESCA